METEETPTPEVPDSAETSSRDENPHDEKKSGSSAIVKSAFVSIIIALLLAIASQLITLPYFILSPGSASAAAPYISIPSDKSYPAQGSLLMTTVSVAQAHPFGIVWAWITPHTQILKKKDLIGNSTPSQYFQANLESMDESKMTAEYVALGRAGYSVKMLGDGATIMEVSPNSPAVGKVNVGDTITAVNGTPIGLSSDLISTLTNISPGTVIHLDVVDAKGTHKTVDITTGTRPDNPKAAFVGVAVQTKNPHLQTPFPIELKTDQIGGPSAGLAFTLTALDELTPGNLTGGKKIAVTGTIESDGSVGEVGGVEQKVAAVEASGAKLFIVPASEVAEAQKHASKGLKIVGVNNVNEALTVLAANGGDVSGVPTVAASNTAG